jgi:long-chain fatty acid transport protein
MKRSLLLAALAASLALPSTAHAGGFYLLDRDTRALGRGGAFVAGADDPSALWYNPAGIGFSGNQVLVDATLTLLSVDYTRVDSGGNTLPTVNGTNAPLPIPTIAGTFNLGLRNFVFEVGIFAPNAALMQWPQSVTVDGIPQAAPQRYSLLNMEGSLIAALALGAAWRPIDELSIGLGVHVIYGSFAAQTALSACDGVTCAFPEDPEYDGVAQLTLNPAFTAVATLGVTYDAGPVRFGVSVMTPYSLSGNASIQVRTPSAAAFDGAFVRTREGRCATVSDQEIASDIAAGVHNACQDTRADMNLDFPWIVRAGVQLEAIDNLVVELAFVYESWSLQTEASVRPHDVWFSDALGGALDYQVGPLSIPRHMRDTFSIRLGGEYTIDDRVQVRLGGYYESGSFDDQWLQALTIDSDKVVIAGGASVRVADGFWIDAMVGYAHLFPRNVTNSAVPVPNPIRPMVNDPDPSVRMPGDPTYVGNGTYNMTAPFFGLGIRWLPDWRPGGAPTPEALEEPEPEPVIIEEPVVEIVTPPIEVAPEEPAPTEVVVPEDQPDEPPARPRRRPRSTRRRPR